MSERFVAEIIRGEAKNTMGLVIPEAVVERLGRGKRPPVIVTIGSYAYASTVASMGGQFLVGISAEHRAALNLEGQSQLEVQLTVDESSRDTPVPADLRAALEEAGKWEAFQGLAPSRRKEAVRQVEEAKTEETRKRRIAKVMEMVK